MASNSAQEAAPFRPSFIPLFEEGGAAGPQRKAPVSLGASEKHKNNRAELAGKPHAVVSGHSSVVQPSTYVPPAREQYTSAVQAAASSSPAQARVVQHNIDDIEKKMMADQAKALHGQHSSGPDAFDSEYDRIVSEASRKGVRPETVSSANDDEFDF
ncbi:Hypothetical protein, putative [Bodo saltans]|uniref:Uncharacterized protein n=1 Tax=Bodo saltans TaxID=75058 RepID=A0A0S4JTW3_BODSA|nr:Hypothetical protein, putative [Bodo saltans]|eukprot:CUG91998.1 Hypothetical protein, putative [Bodo saltans]